MSNRKFSCYLVRKDATGKLIAGVAERSADELPEGDVLLQVAWSSLNYKDALAARGHPGVARQLPHVPGVDAAGEVLESRSAQLAVGDQVMVMGYGLGDERWGGWAGLVRVPAEWVLPLPAGLTLRQTMVLGTAGFTAALCVTALQENGVQPDQGEVVVTGASGGVGAFAVMLLSRLGYRVVAASGKPQARPQLIEWGAARVIDREEVNKTGGKPLLNARWSGAVDTVGGGTLVTLLRETRQYGCVAACGLVGGADLPLTVFPFILRGVTLAGIDAARRSRENRFEIWRQLAGAWKPAGLDDVAATVGLGQLDHYVNTILEGGIVGRVAVELDARNALLLS